MLSHLLKACEVCEHNAAVEALRQIVFRDGYVFAFNGVVQYQAPSGISADEKFAVAEDRLSAALRSCGEGGEISTTKDFLRLKNGPFSIRVRKLEPKMDYEPVAFSPSAQRAEALAGAMKRVAPFMSADASRPWSISVLVRDEFVWATNNLSLARSPCSTAVTAKIPAPAVDLLCSFPSLDWVEVDERGAVIASSGQQLMRCVQSQAEWPDVAKFFDAFPADLPEIPDAMRSAVRRVGEFSDRALSLSAIRVETKSQALEAEYDIDDPAVKGIYSAKLLSLILSHATHVDFSSYPKPIHFRGEAVEGVAVGIAEQPRSE